MESRVLEGRVNEDRDSELIRERIHDLYENTDFSSTLFNNLVGYAIVAADFDGNIIAYNEGARQIYGYAPEEVIGRQNIEILFPRDFIESGSLQRVIDELLGQERFSFEGEKIRKNGERFPAEILFTLTKRQNEQVVGFVEIVQDISERKHAEEALRTYAEQLKRSNQELQDFAFIASHDLQEPLRKIQTFSDLLLKQYEHTFEERGFGYLQKIEEAAGRMRTLIWELLTLSRITTRGQPFKVVDLNEVARRVVSDLEVRIAETRARVDVGPLPRVLADPTQIAQLFQNLIGNALKFHQEGVSPEIRVRGELVPGSEVQPLEGPPYDHYLRLVFEDNGIGFEEKYVSRIFKPFQRLHGREKYEGTGMGLAICAKIAERHRGTLVARSRPGRGSQFIFTLPFLQEEPPVAPPAGLA